MITWEDYKKRSMKFWEGKKVRTLLVIENGWCVIPVGTIFEITDKYSGFSLKKVDTCPHCKIGRKTSISRVDPTDLELVNPA